MRYLPVGEIINSKYEVTHWLEATQMPVRTSDYIAWLEARKDKSKARHYREGGLGVVYRAYDLNLGAHVALKTYRGPVSRTSHQAQLFRNEAEAWIRLDPHPNVVQAYDVFEYDARYYVVIEFMRRGCLRQQIGRLDVRNALQIAIDICRGMHHAYQTIKMVHRDLKPENILLTPDGRAKITDFGLARIMDHECLSHIGPAGTPMYAAPEQRVNAKDVDTKTDIYAFGIILYEVLTGYRPQGSLPLLPEIPHEASLAIGALINQCIRKCPDERPHDFAVVLKQLEQVATDLGIVESHCVKEGGNAGIQEVLLSIPRIQLQKRGNNFLKLGKFKEAIACYSRLLDECGDSAGVISSRGRAYLALGQQSHAEADFNLALTMDKNDTGAHLGKGDLFAKRGDLKQAFQCYDQAIKCDQSCEEVVLHNKAFALESIGEYNSAIDCYNKLLQHRRTAEVIIKKATALVILEHNEDALMLCNEALQIEPDSMRALGLKAHVHDSLNQIQEALATFLKLLKLDPEFDQRWLFDRIGTAYGLLGDFCLALQYHLKAHKLEPNNVNSLKNCALDLQKLHRWTEAADMYRKLIKLDPSSSHTWYLLGKAHAEAGCFQLAFKALEQCLFLDDHRDAKLLLQHLKKQPLNKEN